MSELPNIKHLEDLLSSNLENGEKIVNTKVSALTAPGENYGSIMLRIDLDIKNEKSGKERTLHIVAKLAPENEFIQEVFNTQLTYRNEYKFYAEIVPTLDKLLKSKGISSGADFVPRFYGGRLNFDGSEVINSDSVILMENLKVAGYATGQKTKGYNLEISKLILDSLAKFHAAGIALRHLEPETFQKKLAPYTYYYVTPDDMYDMAIANTIETLSQNGFSREEIEVVTRYRQKEVENTKPVSKTWGTMIQCDAWTNNFLIKYEDAKPVHAVIVDFQICDYRSSLWDVMFFLFTSVEQDILTDSVDLLLEYYYKQILGYLQTLGVNTELFTKSSYEEEIKLAVRNHEYTHTLWMLTPIMHEAFKSLDDLQEVAGANSKLSEKHVRKIVDITRLSFKKGWLSVK